MRFTIICLLIIVSEKQIVQYSAYIMMMMEMYIYSESFYRYIATLRMYVYVHV